MLLLFRGESEIFKRLQLVDELLQPADKFAI